MKLWKEGGLLDRRELIYSLLGFIFCDLFSLAVPCVDIFVIFCDGRLCELGISLRVHLALTYSSDLHL